MEPTEIEKRTREIFHGLHSRQYDEGVFQRLTSLLSPAYLQEADDFFSGKVCLDAGCGSNANATYSMLHHGAAEVHAFDLDDAFFGVAQKALEKYAGRYRLSVDNVLSMRFEDAFFDFVHCSGVLHHTTDLHAGLRELGRVTKPGGVLYIMTYGKGGIVRDVVTLLRKQYDQEPAFRRFVDELTDARLRGFVEQIQLSMAAHDDPMSRFLTAPLIRRLFDQDLVLTIKDRITAPLYHEHSEAELTDALRKIGFTEIKRLTRYPAMQNLRRFLCPLYHDYRSPLAELLYGDGAVQLKAVKGNGGLQAT